MFGGATPGNPVTGFTFGVESGGASSSPSVAAPFTFVPEASSVPAPAPSPPAVASVSAPSAGAGSSTGVSEGVRRYVFMDVLVSRPGMRGRRAKRVTIELYGDRVPMTVENFRALCTGEKVCWCCVWCNVLWVVCCDVVCVMQSTGSQPLQYKGSRFHRVVPGQCVQGGDFTSGDGRGGMSIYGSGGFKDEGFGFGHERGSLSMANSGPDSNGSQFFVCLKAAKGWDGKHVVFGRVIQGLRVRVFVCLCGLGVLCVCCSGWC